MGILRFTILVYFFMIFSSCYNRSISNDDINIFISKYNDVRFDEFKDISITLRSKGMDEIVYIVDRFGGNRPVYFVTFNLQKQSVTYIDKTNLEKSKVQEYLTKDEIMNAVSTIRKYDFYLLAVDSSENVYINPFYADEPPYLMRLKNSIGDSSVNKGYVYELYKDNWYLNKTRRRD